MRNRYPIIVSSIAVALTLSCTHVNDGTRIRFRIHHAIGHTVYLQPIAFAGEQQTTLDSAIVIEPDQTIQFTVAGSEQRPFNLRVKGARLAVFFINDAPEITIEANIFRPNDFSISNSPATASVKEFLKAQNTLAQQIREEFESHDSSNTPSKNEKIAEFFQKYINYADTVSSPGAFLYVYNSIDFGKDYTRLKKFILRAAARFSTSNAIQRLKNETLDYLRTFEVEYQVGDSLPELTLPDERGLPFSTSSLRGKYVFLDFWSTWCNACLQYDPIKVKVKKKYSPTKFEIVSIALDAEKDAWERYTETNHLDWVQLIDEKMWRGPTLQAYRIDSIPFNFLLDPEGRIISKAIKPDSLIATLARFLK